MKFIKKIALMTMFIFVTCSQVVNNISACDYYAYYMTGEKFRHCQKCKKLLNPLISPRFFEEPGYRSRFIAYFKVPYPSEGICASYKPFCIKCTANELNMDLHSLVKEFVPDLDVKKVEDLKSNKHFRERVPRIVYCGCSNIGENQSLKKLCSICFNKVNLREDSFYACMICSNVICATCSSKYKQIGGCLRSLNVYDKEVPGTTDKLGNCLTVKCPHCKSGMVPRDPNLMINAFIDEQINDIKSNGPNEYIKEAKK